MLLFQFLQPLHIGGLQPAVLGLPCVVGRRADAGLPPDLIDWTAGIGLFQDRYNCVSVNVDCRMRTSWLGWLVCQNVLLLDCLKLGGAYNGSIYAPLASETTFKTGS